MSLVTWIWGRCRIHRMRQPPENNNPPTLIRKVRYRGIFFAQIPQSFTQYVADGWIPCPIHTDPRGRLRCCALSPAAVNTGNWFSTCAIDQRMQADAGNPDQMRMALNGEEAG